MEASRMLRSTSCKGIAVHLLMKLVETELHVQIFLMLIDLFKGHVLPLLSIFLASVHACMLAFVSPIKTLCLYSSLLVSL